jgi:hypothetical protein
VSLLNPRVKFDIKLKIIVKNERGSLSHPKISISECEPFFHNKFKIAKIFGLFYFKIILFCIYNEYINILSFGEVGDGMRDVVVVTTVVVRRQWKRGGGDREA